MLLAIESTTSSTVRYVAETSPEMRMVKQAIILLSTTQPPRGFRQGFSTIHVPRLLDEFWQEGRNSIGVDVPVGHHQRARPSHKKVLRQPRQRTPGELAV